MLIQIVSKNGKIKKQTVAHIRVMIDNKTFMISEHEDMFLEITRLDSTDNPIGLVVYPILPDSIKLR
jgi:hypothetical protein